jgi:hypothetical protein
MSKIQKCNAWAGLAACLAMVFAVAGTAIAQEENQNQSRQDEQKTSDDQKEQSSQNKSESDQSSDQASQEDQSQNQQQQQQQQERQRAQQQRQRQQQERQRQQQERQQQGQQQDRQRDAQSRERSQSSRGDQSSRDDSQWPSPSRYESDSDSRQWSTRESQRSELGSSNRSQQGGLGVNIASDGREGIVVLNVHRGSPAEEMGIRPGDRITQVNGQQVDSTQDFITTIRNMDPGEEVQLDIRRARGGGERTVSGELESRAEALVERGQQGGRYGQQERWLSGQESEFGRQSDRYTQRDEGSFSGRENRQTSYEEDEQGRFGSSQGRSGQMSDNRIQQLERQVDRLSQQIDDLRTSLRDIRRQGGASTNRERTARYDEYESRAIQSPRRTTDRDEGQRRQPSDRWSDERSSDQQRSGSSEQRRYESQRIDPDTQSNSDDAEPESPGGEIGEDRQHVGTEDLND